MPHPRPVRVRVLPWLAMTVSACGHATSPAPPGDYSTLVRRDYDQACQTDFRERPVFRASEIFDTVGLGAQLTQLEVPPLSPDSATGIRRWQTLDFISRYRKDGRPGPRGVWQTTLDSAKAARVQTILGSRVRRLPSLLEPTGFHTVVRFTPRPTIATAPAVICLPHMMHARNERPYGLPRHLTTWLEPSWFRPNMPRLSGPDPIATVRIHLDANGTVTAVDSVAGDSRWVARARAIVGALSFYPALDNGEGRAVAFVQSFAFQDTTRAGGGGLLPGPHQPPK